MTNPTLFQKEYNRLLYTYHNRIISEQASIRDEKSVLKQQQKAMVKQCGLHLAKTIFVSLRSFSELRSFERNAESRLSKLRADQELELHKLRMIWASGY